MQGRSRDINVWFILNHGRIFDTNCAVLSIFRVIELKIEKILSKYGINRFNLISVMERVFKVSSAFSLFILYPDISLKP